MQVYDFITADQIQEDDQILVKGIDPIEVKKIVDSGSSIWVKGYSHMSGDDVDYILGADDEVGLWGA